MRKKRKEIVLAHTVTMVRDENKLPKCQCFVGNSHDLMRMIAVTLSENQEV